MSRRAVLLMILPPAALAVYLPLRPTPGTDAEPATQASPALVSAAPAQEFATYARLLSRHVREGMIGGVRLNVVDYAALREDPDLALALDELATARPEAMNQDDRLAFWINAYNLLAIRLVTDAYPIERIQDVESGDEEVWGMAAGSAGGRLVSLGEIENEILRRQFREPRIHFALVAAAISCPDLRRESYDGDRLDEQLEEATRLFLADEHRGARRRGDGVEVSHLLHSFHEDFEPGGVVAFLRAHGPASVAERLQGLDDHHDLGKIPYQWNLNDRARSSVVRSGSHNPARQNGV